MMKPAITDCTICREHYLCRHFELYVIGSEGIWLCHSCEMSLVRFVGQEMSKAGQRRKEQYLKMRQARNVT